VKRKLEISKIQTTLGTQLREQMCQEAIKELAVEYAVKEHGIPDPTVFEDAKGRFILADGFHRLSACKTAGIQELVCDVRKGELRDAVMHAAGCNHGHGVRRTQEDKRKCILALLAEAEWAAKSDAWIAAACKVSDKTVAAHRPATSAEEASNGEAKKREGRDGKARAKKGDGKKSAQQKERQEKNGQPTIDWKPFTDSLGVLVRTVDSVGKAYKAKDSKEAAAFRRRLEEYRSDFREWFKAISKPQPAEAK
jgi:hypothetical protein